MNTIKFNQTGGFPLSTDILNQLQANYQIFSALGSFAGELGILIGCEEVGGKVSPGVMIIKGEVIEFEGGLLSSNVIISEIVQNKIFEDGTAKHTLVTRKALFGNALEVYPWVDFYRVKTQKSLADRIQALENKPNPIPLGLVAIWNKPSNIAIPQGWQEVVDLRGKIPVGMLDGDADFGTIGQTGGAKTQKILKTHLPAEGVKIYPSRSTSGNWSSSGGSGRPSINIFSAPFSNQYEYTEERISANLGDGTDFNMMNPYRVIKFIEYVG